MLIYVWEKIVERIDDPYSGSIDHHLKNEYKKYIFKFSSDIVPRVGEDIRIAPYDWTVTNVAYECFDNCSLTINLTVKKRDKERLVKYGSHCWNEPNVSILDLETIEGE